MNMSYVVKLIEISLQKTFPDFTLNFCIIQTQILKNESMKLVPYFVTSLMPFSQKYRMLNALQFLQ